MKRRVCLDGGISSPLDLPTARLHHVSDTSYMLQVTSLRRHDVMMETPMPQLQSSGRGGTASAYMLQYVRDQDEQPERIEEARLDLALGR